MADENLQVAIVEGARRKRPGSVFLTAAQAQTLGLPDPSVLQRAKELDVILVSHDFKTMYGHYAAFLMQLPGGEHSPGVFLVAQEHYSVGQIIEFVIELYDLSEHAEWRDRITTLPL